MLNNLETPGPGNDNGNRNITRIIFLGFLLVAGFFLFTEHSAHLFGVWPYLFLLACPLMHRFMHHGRGHHHGRSGALDQGSSPEARDKIEKGGIRHEH